jgi:hypothetical protein
MLPLPVITLGSHHSHELEGAGQISAMTQQPPD